MNRKRLILVSIGMIVGGLIVQAQQPLNDPMIIELHSCLRALVCPPGQGNCDPMSLPDREFQIFDNQNRELLVQVLLFKDGIRDFWAQRYQIEANDSHSALVWKTVIDNVPFERPVSPADLHSLRWQVSLDPFWVLHHILQAYWDNPLVFSFTQEEIEDGDVVHHVAECRCFEPVLLSDAEEKLYGTFEETLLVDTDFHQIIEYKVLALDPDGIPIQDMFNSYTYGGARGSWTIQVAQSSATRMDKAAIYEISPVQQ